MWPLHNVRWKKASRQDCTSFNSYSPLNSHTHSEFQPHACEKDWGFDMERRWIKSHQKCIIQTAWAPMALCNVFLWQFQSVLDPSWSSHDELHMASQCPWHECVFDQNWIHCCKAASSQVFWWSTNWHTHTHVCIVIWGKNWFLKNWPKIHLGLYEKNPLLSQQLATQFLTHRLFCLWLCHLFQPHIYGWSTMSSHKKPCCWCPPRGWGTHL